jgi:hypothetical protein
MKSYTALTTRMMIAISLGVLLCGTVPVAFASGQATGSAPTVVQFADGSAAGGSATLVTLTFPQPVAQGDVLVICAGIASGNVVKIHARAPTDTLGTTFTSITKARSSVQQQNSFAKIWYGVASSSGTETVSLSYISGPSGLYGYEVSGAGINVSGFMSSQKHDNNAPTTGSFVTPYAPAPNSLVIACGGFFNPTGSTEQVKAGPGYILDGSFFGSQLENAAEHLAPSSGSTSSPFTFSPNPVYHWSEVSVSINEAV